MRMVVGAGNCMDVGICDCDGTAGSGDVPVVAAAVVCDIIV
jgi:hypothetical protein